eukprot:467067_1
MAEGHHEHVETIDLDDEMGGKVHATHANANSEQFNQPLQNSTEIKLHNLEVELHNLDTMQSQKTDYIYCILSIIILLWLSLSAFTLIGFIWAFGGYEILFRVSFFFFSWFMTFINLPFVIRPLLNGMTLWYPMMDEFNH